MKRGRKSSADLAVVLNVAEPPPPTPPSELSADQAKLWDDAVRSMTGRWTKAAYPILVAYCEHVVRARLLDQTIREFKGEWIKKAGGIERLDKLLKMAARENAAAIAAARALRLTPRSQIFPISAGRRAVVDLEAHQVPWKD